MVAGHAIGKAHGEIPQVVPIRVLAVAPGIEIAAGLADPLAGRIRIRTGCIDNVSSHALRPQRVRDGASHLGSVSVRGSAQHEDAGHGVRPATRERPTSANRDSRTGSHPALWLAVGTRRNVKRNCPRRMRNFSHAVT